MISFWGSKFIFRGEIKDKVTLKITKMDKFGQVLARPEFQGIENFVIPVPGGLAGVLMKELKLGAINAAFKTWNVDDVAVGLNHLAALVAKGVKVHHDIWSSAEKAVDPRKRDTALFYLPVEKKGPFALVCSGGAYLAAASFVDAFPVAAELNRLGHTAFVLHYRTGRHNRWPAAQEDLRQALHTILTRADAFNIDPTAYALVGFSAGGHLISNLGKNQLGYRHWGLPKPGALILGYPVTIWENMTWIHKTCLKMIVGKKPTQAQMEKVSILPHVDGDFPPTFIMHCRDDRMVYFQNAQALTDQLKTHGVPYVLRDVPHGGHGIGLGTGTQAEGWLGEAVRFWQAR
jgi:acetyl esterase/lipase